jgi:DNA-binding beta-propeller fold protein YncE
VVTALVLVMAVMALAPERAEGPRLSAQAIPARLAWRLESPVLVGPVALIEWNQPSAMAILDGRLFVLDTGNSRILELDEGMTVRQILDDRHDERLALQGPMDMTSDGRYLYVANSGASQVLVLSPDGRVVRVLSLDKVDPRDQAPPRPIGLAVAENGELLVSDGDNHRVLRYGPEGRLLQAIGTGGRANGERGFNTPAGLALDAEGNVYVVDILNGRVVQLSPDGEFLREFGRLGDTAGTFARPKDVAVDWAGNVYVSDGLLASVQVFSPEGRYLGFVGREDPHDRNSDSLFRAPSSLMIGQDGLYVVDRFSGLLVFELAEQGP